MGQKKKKKYRGVTTIAAKLYDPELYSIMGNVRDLQYKLDIKPFIDDFHWTKLPR